MNGQIQPSQKTTVAALGGALSVVLMWCVEQFAHVTVPSEVASSVTVIVMFFCGYITPPGLSDTSPTSSTTVTKTGPNPPATPGP